MATYVGDLWDNSLPTADATYFAVWGQGIEDALAGAGLVKTSDTGQYVFATGGWWSSTSFARAGYQIWRFNDTLQSTAPIFLRIEYGHGYSTSTFAFQFDVYVGTGSNGSGTLTGAVGSTPFTVTTGTSTTNTLTDRTMCGFGGEGYAGIVGARPAGASTYYYELLLLDRGVQADGSLWDGGLVVSGGAGGAMFLSGTSPSAGTGVQLTRLFKFGAADIAVPGQYVRHYCPSDGVTTYSGGTLKAFPLHYFVQGVGDLRLKSAMKCVLGDFNTEVEGTVTNAPGGTGTYRAVGHSMLLASPTDNGNQNLLVRWEA